MQVRCNLCGGENTVHPGQEMLFCSYCGSALALEDKAGPEHLILPHKRNDKTAVEALGSFFLSRNRARPQEMEAEFSYVPYLVQEDENDRITAIPALESSPLFGPIPFPPTGSYRFFDEKFAENEKIRAIEKTADGVLRILHLPVYLIRYASGKWSGTAMVIGESWQVVTDDLPPERAVSLDMTHILAAFALFVVFLFLGRAVSSWSARLLLLFGVSALGFAVMTLHDKLVKKT
jgi:hypothetical protein